MQFYKTQFKKLLRDNLPQNLYSLIYVNYQKYLGNGEMLEHLQKYATFTKKGLYNFELDDVKFKMFLNPNNGAVDYEIFANKNFEPGILRLIKKSLKEKKDSVFIDIGANIAQHGIYASYFAKKVYAFEPIKRLYNQSQDSIFENDILNLSLFNYALGNKKEILPIYSNEVNMGASSILVSESRQFEQNIKVERLDDIYKKIGIEKADFMKIDVEGFEWNVLQGSEKFINEFKPKILIEFTPSFYNKVDATFSKSIYDFLKNLNYTIYDVDNDGSKYIKVESFEQIIKLDQTNLYCIFE